MKARKHEDHHMKEDTRIALLEQSIGHINETLLRFEKRFDVLDADIKTLGITIHNDMKQGFNRLDSRIDSINNRQWLNFFWIVGSFAAILLIMAHGFEWI